MSVANPLNGSITKKTDVNATRPATLIATKRFNKFTGGQLCTFEGILPEPEGTAIIVDDVL